MAQVISSGSAPVGYDIKVRRPTAEKAAELTRKRYAAEARFKAMGLAGILIALGLLGLLLYTIVAKGYSAFVQTTVTLEIDFSEAELDPNGNRDLNVLGSANYQALVNDALFKLFPDVSGRTDKRALRGLMSSGAALHLRKMVLSDPKLVGTVQDVELLASDDVDQFFKGFVDRSRPEGDRRVKDNEIAWIDSLESEDRVHLVFNKWLFMNGDSREPELAGLWGSIVGSFYVMLVVALLAVPLGAAAAIYLEEFAPKNWMTDFIEVNINNLAAVPSIVFGLLGLAVFLQVFGIPRSAPLAGGLTLTLMTLPTIVVATRAALRAVPPSIRDGALGVGASKIQVVSDHVLPLALPGILTGTIIGLAQALGETAPLLMIGMNAFIVDVPSSPLDPGTAMPVQIYIWADSPERAFMERTSAAIMVLLGFMITMNAVAIYMRQKFQIKW